MCGAERDAAAPTAPIEEERRMGATKIISRDPAVMGGELVFVGTRVEVKTLVDYLKTGRSLDVFPTVGREQATAYLEMTLEVAGKLARSPR